MAEQARKDCWLFDTESTEATEHTESHRRHEPRCVAGRAPGEIISLGAPITHPGSWSTEPLRRTEPSVLSVLSVRSVSTS